MRTTFAIIAAPLALLGACGEARVSEEELEVERAGTGLENVAMDPADLPQPMENSLETVDYSGNYTMTGMDGSQTRLVLDQEAGTYTYYGVGQLETTGTIEELGGSRIYLEDVAGRPAWFSVADGALYRLPTEDTPYDEVSTASMFLRDDPGSLAGGNAGADGASAGTTGAGAGAP